jgi:hypothetical protein
MGNYQKCVITDLQSLYLGDESAQAGVAAEAFLTTVFQQSTGYAGQIPKVNWTEQTRFNM